MKNLNKSPDEALGDHDVVHSVRADAAGDGMQPEISDVRAAENNTTEGGENEKKAVGKPKKEYEKAGEALEESGEEREQTGEVVGEPKEGAEKVKTAESHGETETEKLKRKADEFIDSTKRKAQTIVDDAKRKAEAIKTDAKKVKLEAEEAEEQAIKKTSWAKVMAVTSIVLLIAALGACGFAVSCLRNIKEETRGLHAEKAEIAKIAENIDLKKANLELEFVKNEEKIAELKEVARSAHEGVEMYRRMRRMYEAERSPQVENQWQTISTGDSNATAENDIESATEVQAVIPESDTDSTTPVPTE